MKAAIRVLVGVLALFFLVMGAGWMIVPETMAEQFRVAALDAAGASAHRSLFGALFLAMSGLLSLRLAGRSLDGFLVVALFEALIVVGRVVSLLADGSSKEVWPAIAIESVAVVALVAASRIPRSDSRPE